MQFYVVCGIIVKHVYSALIFCHADFFYIFEVYRSVPYDFVLSAVQPSMFFVMPTSLSSRAKEFSRDGTNDRCRISQQLHCPFLNMSDTILLLPLRALKSAKTIKFRSSFYSVIINADNRPSSWMPTTIVIMTVTATLDRTGDGPKRRPKDHKQVVADRRVQSLSEE